MIKEKSMSDFMIKKQTCISQLPLLMLVVSCGASSGFLMIVALLLHLLLCRYYREPVLGPIIYTKMFRVSLVFIFLFFVCSFIPLPFNDGQPRLLFRYISRLAPFILAVVIARPTAESFLAIWYGWGLSLLYFFVIVARTPVWEVNRLFGPFSSPNTLAGLLVIMLPMVLFGVVKYRKSFLKSSIVLLLFSMIAVFLVVCTGSRNAYGTFIISFFVLSWLIYRHRDTFSLKIIGTVIAFICLGIAYASPMIISQRVERNIGQDGRVYLMQAGIQIAKEHPIVGIGAGNWGKVYKERFEAQNPNHEQNIQSPHNIYLHVLDESGIIGLTGFLALFIYQIKEIIYWLHRIYAREKRALPWLGGIGLSIVSVFIFGFLDYDFFSRNMMQIYWLCWGLCLCAIESAKKELGLNE
ncbi:O-antigen ligase family protein [Mitsuokella sp.]|uniref:O-antigen ligase family protein n=1 Tax=Mitsuokella sp. TaxID=2049034 RepID=UPI003D7DA2E7